MKLLIRIGLSVLILLFLTSGFSYAQSTAKKIWIKGVEYAAQGKLKDAKKEFEKALEVNPFSEGVKRYLRLLNYVNQKKVEAKTAVIYFKGIAYALEEQFTEAINEYDKVTEINPRLAEAYISRGLAHGKGKREYDQAVSDFSKAIEINPKYSEAYLFRGHAHQKKEQYDQAISDYSKAIEINPKVAEAHTNRGLAYFKKGQYDKSFSDYNKAIGINPKFAEAYISRAIAYFLTKEYEKAWNDVYKAQDLGYSVHPDFLKALRESSGTNIVHIDTTTGFAFPQRIEGFNFEDKVEYGDARLGYGMNYRSESDIFITVIVYDGGIKDIQDGTDEPNVHAQFDHARIAMEEAVKQGLYKSVKSLPSLHGFSPSFLRASYSIERKDGIQRRSHIFVCGQQKHFVKIRATGPDLESIDSAVSDFLDRLLILIGSNKQIQPTH